MELPPHGTDCSVWYYSLSGIEACFEYQPDFQNSLSSHELGFSVDIHGNTWFEYKPDLNRCLALALASTEIKVVWTLLAPDVTSVTSFA